MWLSSMVAASPSSQASSADIVSVALFYVALSWHGVNGEHLRCPEPGKGLHKEHISACAAAGPGGVCAREVVLQWGRTRVCRTLESLQSLLPRLRSVARQDMMFAHRLEFGSAALEADEIKQYGGRVSLESSLLR